MGEINELYKPLYTADTRYFFITGGRGSLKSSSVHDFVVRLTYETGHGILFTRYTMTSAEKSIIPELKITLDRLKVTNQFEITKNLIRNKLTGSFILFSGIKTASGDQTANLKSIAGITTWVIEEGEDYQDERSFDAIDDSIRTKERQNRIIWIQNPSTSEHFIYKRWLEKSSKSIEIEGYKVRISEEQNVTHIHSYYGIALKYLSKDWIDKALKCKTENPKWYYHNYIGGWLDKAEGAIYTNWSEGEFNLGLPYCYGQDYGFAIDPTTLIRVAVDMKEKVIYAHEEYYEAKQLGTDDIFEINKSRIINQTDLIVGDDHGQQNRLVSDLKKKGLNIIGATTVAKGAPQLITPSLDYKIVITPESHNLRKELSNFIWNDKKAGIPIDAYNHGIDAMLYAFGKLTMKKASVGAYRRKFL